MINVNVDFENSMVLAVVQALVGAIPPSLLAVTLEADEARRTLDIYLAARCLSEGFDDLVEEIEVDVAALIDFSVTIRTHVWVGESWTSEWPGAGHRPVFAVMVQGAG